MQNQSIKYIILAVALILLPVIQGCKSCSDEKKKIHIALAGPMSGDYASVGRAFEEGVRLYLNEVNQKGGINGKKIDLLVFDDQNKSDLAEQRANDIYEQNKAVGVIGHHYSSCSIRAGAVYKQYGIPAISPASTNVKVTLGNPWYFRSSFNDNLQGRFLASYAKTVLQANAVSIIHEDDEYGAYLARIFEETCKEMNVPVRYKWNFRLKDEMLDQTLAQINNEIRYKNDAGVIFISTHAAEGVKLVKLIKDAMIENPIIAPDSFASKSFQEGFNNFPKERNNPGFYTNGISITTPWISDTTNEVGLIFKDNYMAAYEGREPDWHAAFAYDTTMVLVEAIKNSDVQGEPDTIAEDREKIRAYMSKLTSFYDAVKGVTGYNYFDENGDSQKPVFMAVYRNRHLISALTQFRAIPNVNEVPNFEDAKKQELVLMFDGKYSYKINVVYTGIEINKISNIDIEKHSCEIDFFLWFRYQGDIDIQSIEFLNAADPIVLETPAHEKIKDRLRYRLYHVKGRFRMDFFPGHHAFDNYILGLNFRPRGLDRNNLIFAKDVIGMRVETDKELMKKMIDADVLSRTSGWKIIQVWIFQDIAEKTSLGDPDHFNLRAGNLEYSRFNIGIRIKRDQVTVRRSISRDSVAWWFFPSLMATLLLPFFIKGRILKRPFPKIGWFLQVVIAFFLMLSSEVYVLKSIGNMLGDDMNRQLFESIVKGFDILWWVIPAYLLTVGTERFIWVPIEERTGRLIPHIIRLLVALIIYLLAMFGIIAFVFDQRLTSLLATSGVIAMIIGLAIQINIANIFSGIALNVERPFRIGDWVKIGDFKEGKIIDINWRTTRIQSRDGTVLSVPNSQASESAIENFSYPDDGYWQYFTVHVEPHHPPERVKKILLDAAIATEGVSSDPGPSTRFLGLTAGMTGQSESWAANYLISVYVRDYGKKFAYNEAIWMSVWTHLKYAGIKHIMERQEVHMVFEGIKRRQERTSKTLSILQELDIFRPFSHDAKVFLSERMQARWYPPGEIIVKQGDPGNSLFIIVEGTLSVWTKTTEGASIEVARLGAGNFFGEMALMTGEPRTATIVAITDTQLYEITKEDILPLIEAQPEISWALSDVLSERRMATESKKSLQKVQQIDKNTLSTQILGRIQQFFGFKK